jgi:polyhydroxyalkanoate synthesis repressor PhaR
LRVFFEVAGAGWQASLSTHPVDVIEACQRLHNRFAPGHLQIDALELVSRLQRLPFTRAWYPRVYPRVVPARGPHKRCGDLLLRTPAAPLQKLLRNKKCPQDNRGAQNGSRTPLKMLSLLQCARIALRQSPPGSPSSLGLQREPMAKTDTPTTIKKYANRRLYNTGTSTYVTLEDLAAMVKAGEDFLVYDAKTGEDITRSVLAQIIFEQENKAGQNLLPTTFLRQLIRFYGDSMQMVVPKYLEQSIDTLTREQEKFRKQLTDTFSGTPFAPLEEHVRRNMELFQQTFSMFKPFSAPLRGGSSDGGSKSPEPSADEGNIDDLRKQMKDMQERLERMSKEPKKEE